MKTLYYAGLVILALFEILNVYFIMPMPGSQQMNSIDVAYFLYTYRWWFRVGAGALILIGAPFAFREQRAWIPVASLIPVLVIIYAFNFRMTADKMFLQPESLVFKTKMESTLNDSSIVLAVVNQHEAKAYPIRYIQYHHQVRDSICGTPIMVTYCNVCRTGRVFEPLVQGRPETFRLVGMDHFNAMFEDATTKSWWRQATGEAVTGPLRGTTLPEFESSQLTLGRFFTLHPFGKVMDAEKKSSEEYDATGKFEKGKSESHLTRTDTSSWNDKSWVIGVQSGPSSKAYDWNVLKSRRLIHDRVGAIPIVIALAPDNATFIVFQRDPEEQFIIRNDSVTSSTRRLDWAGRSKDGSQAKIIKSYQEFWHSWKQFHPDTERYD